jgi:enoyl-CoA hydratase/carnithine racemase
MTTDLIIEKHGRVTVATLNRPQRRNALTVALAGELQEAVEEFGRDDGQAVLIVTGAGDKAFCSGADLFEVQDRADADNVKPMAPEQDISGLAKCEKPVIAAINGLAVGGGLEITICCDIRLAAEHAWFGLPEIERGFLAGMAAVTLPRMMPVGAVLELMLGGERMSAADAYRLGFVQQVLPADQLMTEAMRRAELMSRYSPSALWGTKKVVRYWRDKMLNEQHQFYQQVMGRVFESGDMEEGLKAFAEKRKPNFTSPWPKPAKPGPIGT